MFTNNRHLNLVKSEYLIIFQEALNKSTYYDN